MWLLWAGTTAAISVTVLDKLNAWPATVVTVALLMWMLTVRLAVPTGRLRVGLLASGMLSIAAVAIGAVFASAG